MKIGANDIRIPRGSGHYRSFLDSLKRRQQPVASAELRHRTATNCHLINIAMFTRKKPIWDPVQEQITNDEAADLLLTPSMQSPWRM